MDEIPVGTSAGLHGCLRHEDRPTASRDPQPSCPEQREDARRRTVGDPIREARERGRGVRRLGR